MLLVVIFKLSFCVLFHILVLSLLWGSLSVSLSLSCSFPQPAKWSPRGNLLETGRNISTLDYICHLGTQSILMWKTHMHEAVLCVWIQNQGLPRHGIKLPIFFQGNKNCLVSFQFSDIFKTSLISIFHDLWWDLESRIWRTRDASLPELVSLESLCIRCEEFNVCRVGRGGDEGYGRISEGKMRFCQRQNLRQNQDFVIQVNLTEEMWGYIFFRLWTFAFLSKHSALS